MGVRLAVAVLRGVAPVAARGVAMAGLVVGWVAMGVLVAVAVLLGRV